jgi:hypothetical protein
MTLPNGGFVAITSNGADNYTLYTSTGAQAVTNFWFIANHTSNFGAGSGVTLSVSGPGWSGTLTDGSTHTGAGSGTVSWSPV